MTTPALPVEPWCLREQGEHGEYLGQLESLFALSNGHLGLRGNLDEGEPAAQHGTYLAGFFEEHPLPYAEAGYGYPESGQTIVNVTNGKLIRLLVDDEPFDMRYGEVVSHERVLDLRAGTLRRVTEWISPAGRRIIVRSTRMVSFTHRAVAAIDYEVEPVDGRTRIIVQSMLVANEEPPDHPGDDPRVAAALRDPLVPIAQDVEQDGVVLLHRTRASELTMGAGMDHDIECPNQYEVEHEAREDWARTSVVTVLEAGQTLRVVKHLAYGWSATRSLHAVRDQVAAALTSARYAGWDTLLRDQRQYLDDFWSVADVEVEGDPILQQAIRFSLFELLQAGARTEGRAIGAKGLTGTGYDGHTFWDIEGFVMPVLIMTAPEAAAHALRWRASTLPLARARARTLGLKGATFPWRTIRGEETSAYWPAGTAAFHVNADIVRAFEAYRFVTGDDSLERECGAEVHIETARLWMSLGHHDRDGVWHIQGVTGPDEYTAVIDCNVFTNLMAALNLRVADNACGRHPEVAAAHGVTEDERAAWRTAADAVHVPYDETLGVHPQCEQFTTYAEWDFDSGTQYPLMLHAPYFQLYRTQVIKQADLVLALHWRGRMFTPEEKARNLDYYERRTVRDSSLSATTQAVVCAEVGHLDLAHAYLHETALVDLRDLQGNTSQGLHIASLAGTWSALVDGFGGLRDHNSRPQVSPALPDSVRRLSFRILWHGTPIKVEATHETVTCTLLGEDGELDVRIYDEDVTVRTGHPVIRPMRERVPLLPAPTQPPGRAPRPAGRLPRTIPAEK
ncbi:glycoside hydrolase family 65 protein [Georgenia sp. 311]|uniref:glycoside hydrolase family 65 protein n=1 Tax=Georgenia sp. 311 TaxID=2585134 RepID=UPI001111B5AA|nr:glycoside hydrolase family 65 protein [Georgenia sp. 311]TNC18300.1 glycoside hydrolase family 65 protein [Georgenia sp. 311]